MRTSWINVEQAIVNTVAYVDAFDYPLTPAEIHRYLVGSALSPAFVQYILECSSLVPGRLSYRDGYYMLPGREAIAEVRRERLAASRRLWPAALRYGALIARMPFVRMVAVTGALAVNNVGPHEDIDYLVITEDDRLWLARAFVLLIVRLAARQGWEVCPNYFLSQRSLSVSQQNLYTAHEITQMIPLYGLLVYEALRRANVWTDQFLPNAVGAPPVEAQRAIGGRRVRRLLEAALATRPGGRLDRWEMTRKTRKFRRLYVDSPESEFTADCCKGHFHMHQRRAIEAYQNRLMAADAPAVRDEARRSSVS